jgi:hypothetical protein
MSRDFAYLELSLLTLPGVVTVHFPKGEPREREQYDYERDYKDALEERLAPLRRAQTIFVIGRASRRGDQRVNEALAGRRASFTSDLLHELLSSDGDLPKILAWGLASDVLVAPASFKAQRATGSHASGLIAWSPEAEARLDAALHPDTDLQMLEAEEIAWVQSALNRAAFVIPLYCEGTEFNPPAAYQGRSAGDQP